MLCEYPKKKKSIIANGKKLVIVKKRYKAQNISNIVKEDF